MNDTTELEAEDQARADLYALFARLFFAGPDAELLAAIAANGGAGGGDAPFEQSWDALALAASEADAHSVCAEYDQVFVGTGKAEVTPYASHYLTESGREKILVKLRDELANLGLARHAATREPEDHFAALFEVMRHLIGASDASAAVQQQSEFFSRYLAESYARFFDAIEASRSADFYKHISRCAKTFMDIESEALKMSNA